MLPVDKTCFGEDVNASLVVGASIGVADEQSDAFAANDGAAAVTVYGTQSLDTSDLSDFTAFADLTVSDVQGWVEAAMGEDEITNMKANLDATIAELVTPTVQTKQVG